MQEVSVGLKIRRLLPSGVPLADETWQSRHRIIVILLLLHVPAIPTFGLLRGFSPWHMALETLPIIVFALAAQRVQFGKAVRMGAATLGLVSSSAIFVHLSGGLIEMHFHFFVMVALITLYQSWLPFLLAIGYVVAHHGLMGALYPESVYNHASAIMHPWRWAAIHGGFILGESAACLSAWRLNEMARTRGDEFHHRLAALVQSSDDAIVGLLPDGHIASWNPGAEKLFGYTVSEVVDRPFTKFIPPDRVEKEKQIIDRFLATHEIQRYETQSLRKDGNLVNVALTLSPIRDEGGRPIGASAIARDMTDETLAQSDREETLSLLKATLESTADGILVVNLDGKIISFNQKFLDLWRIPDEIAESRDDDRAIGFVLEQLKDPESFVEKVKELYEHPKATSFDVLEFKDGRIFERHSQPQEVGGRGVGRVWSFRDVTEREGSKRKLQASLEREQEAAHQLRSLDEIKNAFLAAVSHELRTPLTSVLGTAVTLQERRDAMSREIQDEMFHSLARNARKLERLLSDLLDVDRLVRGVLQPHLETTDVEGLVRNSIEDVDSKDHPIELRVDKVIASIDAPKVQRIVENLVANAVKYTPAGTRIWVTVSPVSGGLLISVEDEGPGVPEEFKQKAFEPFQRGGQNLHAPGTGIGLTLVARFSELHGGKAWIEDRPSGGAVFLVSIPCEIVQSVFESVDGESSAI